MLKKPDPDMPDEWLAYVEVADVKASTSKAMSLGASIKKDITEIPEWAHTAL